MRYLLDTHVLIWTSGPVNRMSSAARSLLEDERNQLMFSSISVYEVTIKALLARPNFRVDPLAFRENLLGNQMEELTFTSDHALAVQRLPMLHRDPFDRALIAQATTEKLTLLTSDKAIASYPGPIVLV